MKHSFSPLYFHARVAICTVSVLLWAQPLGASDVQSPHRSGTAAEASSAAAAASTTSVSQSVPAIQEKNGKPGKYDIDRIGQRDVGHGMNLYSLEKERALGQALASAIDRGTTFVADREVTDYVRQLALKIARNSDAQVAFTVKVIDSPDLRLFALPGGFLYVNKGVIMEVDSEAELAGLMAHEIAHVAARHATRLATRKHAWDMISIPLAYISGPAAIGTNQIAPLSLRKFNRDSEIEADLLGIEYQYAAGYDPQAFVDALEKLHSKDLEYRARIAKAVPMAAKVPFHRQIARGFSNYPPTEERIQKVQEEISGLLPRRDDYVFDTSEFQEVKTKLTLADRPVLRRHRAGDPTNGPVLYRRGSQNSENEDVAGDSPSITKGRPSSVFSYLPVLPH